MVAVAVSGINACGKTTLCSDLIGAFSELGLTTSYVKAPNYDTTTGVLLQRWMRGLEPELSTDDVELLFAKNRDEVAQTIS